MPYRKYSRAAEEMKMGDYHYSLHSTPKIDEKNCKYTYSAWCSNCEINSPRRRSRSETNESKNESCRRKIKEMKTLSPKKYHRSQEYENMEFEYESKGQWQEKDMRFECCRIRSNLCELPTSYISNNCQISSNLTSLPKMSNDTSDFVDCLKSVTSYEHTLKFLDFNDKLENLGTMQDKSKINTVNKINPNNLEYLKNSRKNELKSPIKSGYVHTKSPTKNVQEQLSYKFTDNQYLDYQNSIIKNYEVSHTTCRDYCPLVEFRLHNLSDHRPLCYDTSTYFDRRIDTTNLEEKYCSELEYLRDKLKLLKNTAYSDYGNGESQAATANTDLQTIEIKEVVSTETRSKVRKERRILSPPLIRTSRNKFSVRTRTRVNSAKLKKVKSKHASAISTSLNSDESDCSGSDSENEANLDEDADNVSEPSTDESVKDNGTALSLSLQEPGSGDGVNWPIRPSLFPNIPPYIHFNSHDSDIEYKIPNGRKFFKWKLSTITPIIVRKTLTNSGFALVRKSNQWLGTWGKHMKSPMFKTLKDTQKLNHFPGTFQLGRKDRLWRNFQRMINKYGHKEFGFLPHTYVLPQELKLLKQCWEFKNGTGGEMWIIKPPASARGVGIKVINKWSQLPKKTSLVVQKYISNPYLINGSKFDLRLYVLVTSFNPLRIYLYPEGLARFASAKYSDDVKDLKDRYMHLTNYSINKLSSQYTANEDANACQGHKWTLSKLMEFLQTIGVDTKLLWKNLQQLVIKTIIACESPITQLCEENMNNKYNCYELFGVDVLLDENLKPWLLEVNISPSLHSASPLDAYVKGPLVQTLFNIAQFHLPQRISQTIHNAPQCFDPKPYTNTLTKKERNKHIFFTQYESREDYLYDVLEDLTGDDVRHLTRAEDEYVVKGRFEKIFPTAQTYKYLNFMDTRYYNRLFDAWETKFGGRREEGIALLQKLCAQKVHLKVAPQSSLTKSLPSTILLETNVQPSKEGYSRPLEDIMQETKIANEVSNKN